MAPGPRWAPRAAATRRRRPRPRTTPRPTARVAGTWTCSTPTAPSGRRATRTAAARARQQPAPPCRRGSRRTQARLLPPPRPHSPSVIGIPITIPILLPHVGCSCNGSRPRSGSSVPPVAGSAETQVLNISLFCVRTVRVPGRQHAFSFFRTLLQASAATFAQGGSCTA